MAEVHVFDFDGTLFYSPAPTLELIQSIHSELGSKCQGAQRCSTVHLCLKKPNILMDRLNVAKEDGGLGWFQSLATLSPPHVPQNPDPNAWYVPEALQRLLKLVQRKQEQIQNDQTRTIFLYVLTGRDEKYRPRIEELLANVGVLSFMDGVILKPAETFGTVRFKLGSFVSLAVQHQAATVYYYEDRHEQGTRLLYGMSAFVEYYFQTLNDMADKNKKDQSFAGAFFLPVDPDAALPYEEVGPDGKKSSITSSPVSFDGGRHAEKAKSQGERWLTSLRMGNAYKKEEQHLPGAVDIQSSSFQNFVGFHTNPNRHKFRFVMLLVAKEHEEKCFNKLSRDEVSNLILQLFEEREQYDRTHSRR